MISKTLTAVTLLLWTFSTSLAFGAPRGDRGGGGAPQARPAAAQRQAAPSRREAPGPARRNAPPNPIRTPSMSDAGRRPVRPEIQKRTPLPAQAPAAGKINRSNFEQIKQQLRQGRPQLNAHPSAAELQRSKNRIQEELRNFNTTASRAKQRVQSEHPNSSQWFNNNFFEGRNYHPGYHYHWDNRWRPANWALINNWLNWNWPAPIYYSSQDYPVYYPSEDTVVQAVPQQQPSETSEQGDWLLIGRFTTGTSIQEAPYSNMFVELAVSREGDLAGTYYNATRDQLYSLDGVIDQETQQAIWKMSNRPDSPLMTTGVYNLTQDAAPVTVHFTNGQEQSWVLVRMD